MKAQTTMSFKEFLNSKDLNKDLTQIEKDTVFYFVIMLILAVCMGVSSIINPVIPAYLFL